MASVTGDDGSEDVNDFLTRIRELGDRRDREDDERTRKLEEEIMKGRQERAARRAERARSISPTKDSPASAIGAIAASQSVSATPPPLKPDMPPPDQSSARATSPSAHEPSKPTPPPQSSLARSGTLSWQQRPGSRGTTPTVRSRPLSMVAFDKSSARSPSATPEPSSIQEREPVGAEQGNGTPVARQGTSPIPQKSPNQAAASMLANKDPSWFRQTPDRGSGSAAYRRSEEPSEQDQLSRSGSIRLHGLSRETTAEPEKLSSTFGTTRSRPHSMASPSPALDAMRLDPSNASDAGLDRTPTMSPAQGRMSPERPSSPTKGVGGFVQSAMLKRSDSISKRWSAQVPGGLSRGNSVASNRGSRDLSQMTFASPSNVESEHMGLDATPEPPAQPTPVRDKDGFVKPAIPETPQSAPRSTLPEISTSRPSSPTKDGKRWSPVKASWLENKINQPDSPKPSTKPAGPAQPAWMANLQKAKAARASADLGRGVNVPVKLSPETKRPPIGEKPVLPNNDASPSPPSMHNQPPQVDSKDEEVEPTSTPKQEDVVDSPLSATSSSPVASKESVARSPVVKSPTVEANPPLAKSKPETPPKKDFRSTLRSRPTETDKTNTNEPEFKKAFGNLKRAETKNYKAPDTLKENIMRGKTGLSVTGGPQQAKRVDEFKESILAKKKGFTAAPSKPLARNPSQTNEKPVPEALVKRTGMLNRTKSISEASNGATEVTSPTLELKPSTSAPVKASAPVATVPAGLKNSALAARFNPNLAGILARGPPPASGNESNQPQPKMSGTKASSDTSDSKGPELTHQTKGRARGPKRKAPKTMQTETAGSTAKTPETRAMIKTAIVDSEKESAADIAAVPSDSMHDKLVSYNQIKAGLVGNVDSIDALGISGNSVDPKFAPTASSPSPSPENQRKSLLVDKSKPPIRSPSTRVVSGSFSPKPAPKPDESARGEPLGAVTETSNKVNASSRPLPIPPPKQSEAVHENAKTARRPSSPSKAKSPSTPTVKRVSTIAKSETPSMPSSPAFRNSPSSSPVHSFKETRSPPVPAKSAVARSIPSSFGSPIPKHSVPVPEEGARQVIQDFFGNVPVPSKSRADIDTQSIINNISRSAGKIKTLRKQIWELMPDGKRFPMPMQGEHVLFENSMYICTHVFGSPAGKHNTEAYLWVGDGVAPSSVEDAQLFARNIAKEAGAGRPIVLHQGKESSNFFEALGGIVIIRRGSSTDSVATYMLCGRKHMGQIAFDETEYHARSLCSGFPFIISATGGRLFLWKGKGAGADELGCARLIAMDICLTGEVEEVDEGAEPASFWEAIRSQDRLDTSITPHWHLKAAKENFATRLFAIDDARPKSAGLAAIQGIQAVWNRRPSAPSSDEPSTSDIREISPYSQSDLVQDGILVLDAYFEVYVILGWRSSARFPAFRSALVFAQEYAILAASQEDRPFVPAAHIVFAGASAPYLKTSFRKWDDKRVTTQPVGSAGETEMLPIHEALAAVTE